MWVRGLTVGVIGVVLGALPVDAQRPGTVELGIFGGATKFDDALRLNGAFSVGGRLGVFLLPGLALEADLANGRPVVFNGSSIPATRNGRSSYAPVHVRLAYNMMMGWRGGLIAGAGFVRTDYGVPYGFGANGLLGFRVGLMDRLQIRADGLVDYMGNWKPEATTNFSGRLGISFLPGPKSHDRELEEIERPRDVDADGILDNVDECRDTRSGVRVDARGCTIPVDSDGDGVVDATDRCPGTPSGTAVDANGCPRDAPKVADQDTDRDGVMDTVDRCGATPIGTSVDSTGCPVARVAPVVPVAPAAPVAPAVPVVVDTDADGVVDTADRCAATPAGERVDASGCPLPKDADADGVVDANDRCAATPAGERVDANGCPLPKDADGDGVLDANDRCANTAPGTTVNAEGCQPPAADADKDGVPDATDRCAETSSGFDVDETGCPSAFKAGSSTVVLRGVEFETGRAALTAQSAAVLDAVAAILISSNQRVEVGVHTDNAGAARTDENLSQSRALAVRSYLVGKGVPAAQLVARGYGGKQPLADNSTEAGKAQNRRVELKKL